MKPLFASSLARFGRRLRLAALAAAGLAIASSAVAAPAGPSAAVRSAAGRLQASAAGAADIRYHRGTGAARFVALPGGVPQARALAPAPRARAEAFVDEYAGLFGLRDSSELRHRATSSERDGRSHVAYDQSYRGIEVFGARLLVHVDADGRVIAANGVTVADISVDPVARIDTRAAQAAARRGARADAAGQGASLRASTLRLLVLRTGLLRGVQGKAHLAYEVEVSGGPRVRDLFYVDAHTGRILERIAGIQEAASRRVYEPAYEPGNLIWSEGDALPYGDDNVDSILDSTLATYELYSSLTGAAYLSYDGTDHIMEAVNDIGQVLGGICPNAFWNSSTVNFCDAVTSDDIVAHEWTHAYTEHTSGLIYAYQSGALNEAYSDIFGETVDLLNGTGTDLPDAGRGEAECSLNAANAAGGELLITAPAGIAGIYAAGTAEFGTPLDTTGLGGEIVLADDGDSADDGRTDDGCQSYLNAAAVTGKIALVMRGGCLFTDKAVYAQAAGAIGMIVINNQGDAILRMAGQEDTVTIPSILIGQSDGATLVAELGNGLAGTMRAEDVGTIDTWRWLIGEDSTAFGGAIRDMWAPECLGNPGRVGDPDRYVCGTGDNGGVHSNSGVPNHAFALLVDGGTYNGTTVAAIGLTKAAAIHWRAMSVYEVPLTDFVDHADALEQSCADLLGQDVPDLETGAPSGAIVTAADCDAVAAAITAVEMRGDTPCSHEPLLDPDAPPLCPDSGVGTFVEWDFETDPTSTWAFENDGVYAEYIPRSWLWTDDLPDERAGSALYAADPTDLGNCMPGDDDQAGVVYATTAPIALPEGSGPPRLVFDHYVATEALFDGGNVSISVNDGPFQLIGTGDFTFNGYNQVLAGIPQGNPNPLGGEPAFTGTNQNSNQGSWGQSQVELSWYAAPGDTIRLRFAFGIDGCAGADGWYIDDVRVYSCEVPVDGIDPFVCSRDRLSRGEPPFDPLAGVELFTQFDGSGTTPSYEIQRPVSLCAPRAIEGTVIADSSTHLAGYAMDADIASPPHAVAVDTVLGRTWANARNAETVLVPASADPRDPVAAPENSSHALDSYACYKLRKSPHAPKFPAGTVVDISDSMGETVSYSLRKPSRLCVAADLGGAGVKNEGTWGHLLCYKAKRLPDQASVAAVGGIYTAGEFGDQRVDLIREEDVCVPASITDLGSLGH